MLYVGHDRETEGRRLFASFDCVAFAELVRRARYFRARHDPGGYAALPCKRLGNSCCSHDAGSQHVFPGQHTTPEDLLDMMERECVTFALGVPTIWTAVVAALERSPSGGSSRRRA